MGGLLHLVQQGGNWAGPVYQLPYFCIMGGPLLCSLRAHYRVKPPKNLKPSLAARNKLH